MGVDADNISLRVLLVEDDEDDYILIRDLLGEIKGFELRWATGYTEALKELEDGEHDVCLLDYRLGEHSGLELLEEARGRGYTIPMILLTGQGDREVDLLAMEAGAADYLLKGEIDAPTLERSVRYAFARALRALSESERRFRSLVHNGSDIITVLDARGVVLYESPSVERVLGWQPEELVGRDVFDYIHPEDAKEVRDIFERAVSTSGITGPVQLRFAHKDGMWRYLEVVGNNLLAEPTVGGVVINSRDVTEHKVLEQKLVYQALHDPLTGLPNRTMFIDLLQQAIERARQDGRSFALLFLDLDNFKVINDSLGHQAGDELLAAVAKRFERFLRSDYTVARFGGDEFTVLLEDVGDIRDVSRMAELILQLLSHPFSTGKGDFSVTCSVGIVLWTPSYLKPESLLRDADTAMYQAKSGGKSRYAIFDPSMNVMAVERMKLERDLRTALDRNEFVVHYQPKVLPEDGKLTGVEALVRWNHPERGLVAPLKFIPVAEETGLIVPLGRRVLREACRQMREWQERYPSDPPLVVSVNVSARQFHSSWLVAEVDKILRETGLEPVCLALEITESMIQDDVEDAIKTLKGLRRLGVGLEIDDFGTGYSSFSYLKRFPVDTLKIDKSFVSGLREGGEDVAIARAIVNVAHTLGLKATAEGAETREQLEQLKEIGCDQAQGYLFSRPLDGATMASFMETGALQLGEHVQK